MSDNMKKHIEWIKCLGIPGFDEESFLRRDFGNNVLGVAEANDLPAKWRNLDIDEDTRAQIVVFMAAAASKAYIGATDQTPPASFILSFLQEIVAEDTLKHIITERRS